MAVSILEALYNAENNISIINHPIVALAKQQLHNAIVLLEKGYNIDQEVEPLLEDFGDVENVPDIN